MESAAALTVRRKPYPNINILFAGQQIVPGDGIIFICKTNESKCFRVADAVMYLHVGQGFSFSINHLEGQLPGGLPTLRLESHSLLPVCSRLVNFLPRPVLSLTGPGFFVCRIRACYFFIEVLRQAVNTGFVFLVEQLDLSQCLVGE